MEVGFEHWICLGIIPPQETVLIVTKQDGTPDGIHVSIVLSKLDQCSSEARRRINLAFQLGGK